jgi:DNA-binding CsgD family transcriptional regulator/tetratricopeptide (TPR) repeat protein
LVRLEDHANSGIYPADLHGVYALIVRGDQATLRRSATTLERQSVPRMMVDAAIALNEGRVDRCRSLYERALNMASRAELPYVVDLVAPFLLLEGSIDRYERLKEACPAIPYFLACFTAIEAIVAAGDGDCERSYVASEKAARLSESLGDELLHGRVLQRLAYAALKRRDLIAAAELAARSAKTLESVGAHRTAATAYSIAYNVHHAGTGDFERAEIYAEKLVVAARRSADLSLENYGLVAQYEMACESADESAASRLRKSIDGIALAEQYEERFARGIGDALLSALRGDVPAFHANAVLLRDVLAKDRPSVALASALQALGAAAGGDYDEARRCSRNALGLASLNEPVESAHSSRYRALARALAASACSLIGDNVRAERATLRHAGKDEHSVLALVRVAHGADVHDAPRRLWGYARAVALVRDAIRRSFRNFDLSESEFVVLRLLAQGMNAPQVALRTGRSVHTIRAHTRSIIAKFGVSGRAAAIAHAQLHGLLQ